MMVQLLRKGLTALLIVVFHFSLCTAQELSFQHINTKGYTVKTIYRDVHGIVWLGTSSGLVSLPQLESQHPERYVRRHEATNTSISLISGDDKGQLWLRTNYSDMFLYNPQTDSLTEATGKFFEPWGITIWKDFSVGSDEEHTTWIWKDDYLLAYDRNTRHVQRIDLLPKGTSVRYIRKRQDLIAVLTKASICYISISDKKIIRTIPLPEEQLGVSSANRIVIDQQANVWTYYYNKLRKYDYAADRWQEPIDFPAHITAIECSDKGRLWVATAIPGVYICDSNGHVVSHLQHSAWNSGSLQSDQIDILYFEEAYQTMWIAYSKGGLSVCHQHQDSFQQTGIHDADGQDQLTDVLTFTPAKDGSGLWAGTERRGVFFYDYNSKGWHNVIGSGSATALMTARDGTLWAGLYMKGLVHKTSASDRSETLYFSSLSPFAITEDEHGALYVALLSKGVWRLDPATGATADTHIKPKYVYDLKYHEHCVYAATTEGLYRYSKDSLWQQIYAGQLRSLVIDTRERIWLLGHDGNEGLTIVDLQGRRQPTPDDLCHAQLKSITIDEHGRIWITTSSELLMLQYDANGQLQRHTFNINGFDQQPYYNHHAIMADSRGTLWLGTSRGYKKVDTHSLTKQTDNNHQLSPLTIGAISINGNQLSPGIETYGHVILQSDIVYTRELFLHSNENNLVIECTPTYAEAESNSTYYYQLKGQSDTWFPMKGRSITLSNLPAGDYQLLTKTSRSQASQLLAIHIDHPVWLSWWACLCYALVAATLAWLLIRYYLGKRAYTRRLREIEQQQDQQNQLNEMKLRFFTNISHDLRTPLSLIVGPVEELRNTSLEEMKSAEDIRRFNSSVFQPALETIQRNAQHLLTLLNQILDFRRLEFGREKLTMDYGNIVTLVGDVCDSFRLKAKKEEISLVFRSDADRIETMVDRDKITKVMMNLLSNAFKFTNAKGSITVRTFVTDKCQQGSEDSETSPAVTTDSAATKFISVSITDSGNGIPDSDKPHIFDRFYQSADHTATSIGSGIGLHIVREYVRMHGGDITVSDNPAGKGTTFMFYIPLRERHDQPVQELPQSSAAEETAPDSEPVEQQHTTTLLIVDDNVDMQDYIRRSFATDYTVITAANGREALEKLQSNDADLVVSDVMMPEMDGLELCRRIKTDIETSHIPVILLTAKAMTNDELSGLKAGADDYITKPFSMDILRQRIHNLMERSRQQHERFAKEIDIEPSEITVTSLDEKFIARAIEIVEAHISEPDFKIEQLSEEMGVHRAQLYKKLHHLTGKTPQQFVRIIRLKRGKQLLEQSGLYVSEVAYQVGFNSPRIFSKYFKEEFGVTPKGYTKQE